MMRCISVPPSFFAVSSPRIAQMYSAWLLVIVQRKNFPVSIIVFFWLTTNAQPLGPGFHLDHQSVCIVSIMERVSYFFLKKQHKARSLLVFFLFYKCFFLKNISRSLYSLYLLGRETTVGHQKSKKLGWNRLTHRPRQSVFAWLLGFFYYENDATTHFFHTRCKPLYLLVSREDFWCNSGGIYHVCKKVSLKEVYPWMRWKRGEWHRLFASRLRFCDRCGRRETSFSQDSTWSHETFSADFTRRVVARRFGFLEW